MSFLARLFGNDPASRLKKAERLFAKGQWNEVRLELDGLEDGPARAMHAEASQRLAALNLAEAEVLLEAGEPERAREHIEMAMTFGADPAAVRATRRKAREMKQETALVSAQPTAVAAPVEGNDPLWSLPADDPRLRYAMLLEAWPDPLRERLIRLGPDFARAVLTLEDGDPRVAWEALGAWVEQEPVARFERARAALQAGQLALAAADLHTFGALVGHCRVGPQHSAVLLAQVLIRLGKSADALTVVQAELSKSDDLALAATRAELLLLTDDAPAAERATVALLKRAGTDLGLYRLLAQARLRQDDRVGAMNALEGGLSRCCSSPGKCGNQRFDVHSGRLLARLLLEDRVHPERVAELLAELAKSGMEPAWEDRYLLLLRARNAEDPETPVIARRLISELPDGDPRQGLVRQALSIAA